MICDFLQWLSINFLQKTVNKLLNCFVTVHIPRNKVQQHADISMTILVLNLPLQPVIGLGYMLYIFLPC